MPKGLPPLFGFPWESSPGDEGSYRLTREGQDYLLQLRDAVDWGPRGRVQVKGTETQAEDLIILDTISNEGNVDKYLSEPTTASIVRRRVSLLFEAGYIEPADGASQ